MDEVSGYEPEMSRPGSKLFRIYKNVKYRSNKHSSYFHVYEKLFGDYVGKHFTFVEVGVLNGGSLFMWREFFGPDARIIGVEMNPAAKQWEAAGFEIFIGSQSDPEFWDQFFSKVGPIDILLDDGGHTNAQQIITLQKAADHVRDGGMIVVEDTHCSYFTEFGNPFKYSFVSYAKRIVDHIHARHPKIKTPALTLGNCISSIRFFESMVAFEIDRRLCFQPHPTSNGGITASAKDFRYEGSIATAIKAADAKVEGLSRLPGLWRVRKVVPYLLGGLARMESRRLRRLFE